MSQNEIEGDEQNQIVSEPEEEQPDISHPAEINREILLEKIQNGVEKVGKTSDGLGYAYTSLNLERKSINNLYNVFEQYPHLRKVNLNDNLLNDVAGISSIKYLTHLSLQNNELSNWGVFQQKGKLEFLESLDLSKNIFKSLENLALPSLKKLNLNKNQITTCAGFSQGHAKLEVLELRKNRLENCQGLSNCWFLTSLYLAQNKLTSIQGLQGLPSLKQLHLRKNEIESFGEQMPDLPLLNYINLRENKIRSLAEVSRLKQYSKSLHIFSCQDSPIFEEVTDNLKKEIVMLLPFLKKINKEVVEQEEVDDALKELNDRKIEEENKRREQEEQARLEAEQNKGQPEEQEEEQ